MRNTLIVCTMTRSMAVVVMLLLGACASTPDLVCNGPSGNSLQIAIEQARSAMRDGCATYFDDYFADLLHIAEGDPKPENKQAFSEFLMWASDEGILNRRQAQSWYNRYFAVKFVSLMGDYNNCSSTCPRKDDVMARMETELKHKEQGLMRVSQDKDGYYRADRLLREAELVLAATCSACEQGT